jgi:hypothetical protein
MLRIQLMTLREIGESFLEAETKVANVAVQRPRSADSILFSVWLQCRVGGVEDSEKQGNRGRLGHSANIFLISC